jgi:small-conductance mechanosensitive channel
MKAELDEQHTIIRPTPAAAAIAAILFYYYTARFITDMIGVSTYQ